MIEHEPSWSCHRYLERGPLCGLSLASCQLWHEGQLETAVSIQRTRAKLNVKKISQHTFPEQGESEARLSPNYQWQDIWIISCGCHTKDTVGQVALTTQTIFLTVLDTGNLDFQRVRSDRESACTWLSFVCSHMEKKGRTAASFERSTNLDTTRDPFMSWPHLNLMTSHRPHVITRT